MDIVCVDQDGIMGVADIVFHNIQQSHFMTYKFYCQTEKCIKIVKLTMEIFTCLATSVMVTIDNIRT